MKAYWDSFLAILFPPYCIGCTELLVNQEQLLCTACQFHLPLLNQHKEPVSDVVKRLRGNVALVHGLAYLSFTQSSIVQNIVHQLKYKGRQDVGYYFGELIAEQLAQVLQDKEIDLIVPIPLHRRKLKERGYNQAECIAKGISKRLNIPMDTVSLIRCQDNRSQTKFWGLERFENVADAFYCMPEKFMDKHVLLVDDVLTTGATMTAVAESIFKTANARVSAALLALA